jgi:hypothetical protein
MNNNVQKAIKDLESNNDLARMNALKKILSITDNKVDWIYEEWDNLVKKLENDNSYQRSIAIMVICNLAKSDGEQRMEKILGKLLSHTKDEKFITSRQCILNIWKVAVDNSLLQEKVVKHLETRFMECEKEKHYNLLRQDIIISINNIYKARKDQKLREIIMRLISTEKENKYKKKYESLAE